jgi:hypothetical protein
VGKPYSLQRHPLTLKFFNQRRANEEKKSASLVALILLVGCSPLPPKILAAIFIHYSPVNYENQTVDCWIPLPTNLFRYVVLLTGEAERPRYLQPIDFAVGCPAVTFDNRFHVADASLDWNRPSSVSPTFGRPPLILLLFSAPVSPYWLEYNTLKILTFMHPSPQL